MEIKDHNNRKGRMMSREIYLNHDINKLLKVLNHESNWYFAN